MVRIHHADKRADRGSRLSVRGARARGLMMRATPLPSAKRWLACMVFFLQGVHMGTALPTTIPNRRLDLQPASAMTPFSASMSSIVSPYVADYAIDGDVTTFIVTYGSPESGTYNWLSVYVDALAAIGDVVVTARSDVYYGLLNPFEVYAGMSPGDYDASTAVQCGGSDLQASQGGTVTVSCGGVTGKLYVTVVKKATGGNGYLSLSEVEIYPYLVDSPSPLPTPSSPLPSPPPSQTPSPPPSTTPSPPPTPSPAASSPAASSPAALSHTVTLNPGWTWFSSPLFATSTPIRESPLGALDFLSADDLIKDQRGFAIHVDGYGW